MIKYLTLLTRTHTQHFNLCRLTNKLIFNMAVRRDPVGRQKLDQYQKIK